MPTTGIKTSLHEVRHAIIAEIFGLHVIDIRVIERFSGVTSHAKSCKDSLMKFIVTMAPYIKRIKTFTWEDFWNEYSQLSEVRLSESLITKAKKLNMFYEIIDTIDAVLEENKGLTDGLVRYLDRNGKGTPEHITRKMFLRYIDSYSGLKGKDKLINFYKSSLEKWNSQN